MILHKEPHPMVGKTLLVRKKATHFQDPNFGGSELTIEDWQDRVIGQSWMAAEGNPACMVYALRAVDNKLPLDNEVIYGKTDNGLGHLVHVSELAERD